MSWGYWGIVAGLVALVATFFICVKLVSSNAKSVPDAASRPADRLPQMGKEPPASGRQAA